MASWRARNRIDPGTGGTRIPLRRLPLEIRTNPLDSPYPRGTIDLRGRRRATRSSRQEKTPVGRTTGVQILPARRRAWEVRFPGSTTGILRALYSIGKHGPPACRCWAQPVSAPLVSVAHDERSGADHATTTVSRKEALRRTWSLGTDGDFYRHPPRDRDLGDVGLTPGAPVRGPFFVPAGVAGSITLRSKKP